MCTPGTDHNRGVAASAPTVEATGRSGRLPSAAAEVTGVPVCQFHDDDLDRSLRNLALGVPGPGSVPAGLSIEFDDLVHGPQRFASDDIGDFVIRRRDGLYAYQLAVVLDDAWQGVTDIVRGADLLDSTPRQVYLQQRLGLPTPTYAHLPVVRDADGRKLGKSLAALPVDERDPLPALRAALVDSRAPRPGTGATATRR